MGMVKMKICPVITKKKLIFASKQKPEAVDK